ncbi:unnamed protein product [Adineta steineri]|uniref:Uncharacterized protein n=1 Tax=Adineta steineri TaxID=433720 RepID=A0A815IV68_9BILA|nr:unnamed protein product [Adineta steineri]CAF1373868.1 unnamed protein product [Adineta steineri]
MSEIPYGPLSETNSTPRNSISVTIPRDSVGTVNSSYTIINTGTDNPSYLCRICKSKLFKKQELDHTPIDCLSQRCELLESENVKLKDRDMKSRIQIKELETKLTALEDAIKGLTAPKQEQAAPFNFSSGQKVRNPFKKAQSVDVVARNNSEINYDNILPPKQRSGSRERVGLFGSLGAASQMR